MKKIKKINLLVIILTCVITLNIGLSYTRADGTTAEPPVVIPDQNINIELNNKEKNFTNAIECYTYAEAALKAGTCYSTITGYVKGSWKGNVMVHQSMDNVRYFDNNGIRYSESKSLKKGTLGRDNYQRTAYNPNDSETKVYKVVTTNTKNGAPDYSKAKWQAYSQEDYENEYGSVPGNLMYLVRESTVQKVETFERTEDGGYHVVLTLNKVSSVQSYKKLLRSSAGEYATNYPKFSLVRVEAWIDKYGNFTKNIMDDRATIAMGLDFINFNCLMVSHYEETFHIVGGDVPQPFESPIEL